MLRARDSFQGLTFRQQIKYVEEITSLKTGAKIPQEFINELKDFIQDEEARQRPPASAVMEYRNKLTEDASKEFKYIKKTIYLERKPARLSIEDIMICTCESPQQIKDGKYSGLLTVPCGKKCLNRVVNTECCASLCVAGDRCSNRRFQLQQHAQIYPIKTELKGWGLAAGQKIKKGQFIIQYVGEVFYINSDLGRRRLYKYLNSQSTYLMSVSYTEVIDPTRKGNLSRFINHSCDPNCETQKWNIMGELVIGLFAKRDILEDEELTFDYKFDTHKTWLMQCFCGSNICRKFLGLVRPKENHVKGIFCQICAGLIDEKSLLLCSSCSQGCHISCIALKSSNESLSNWCCGSCKAPKAQTDQEEVIIKLDKVKFDCIKLDLADFKVGDVQIFWDVSYEKSVVSLYIRGKTALETGSKIQSHLQTSSFKSSISEQEGEITSIDVTVPKNYSIHAKKYLDSNKSLVLVDYEEQELELTELFPLNTSVIFHLTGRQKNVDYLVKSLSDYIDHLCTFTISITEAESDLIQSDFLSFRNLVYPIEVLLLKKPEKVKIRHPFWTYKVLQKQLVFIGKEQNMQISYRAFTYWISEKVKEVVKFWLCFPSSVSAGLSQLEMPEIEVVEKRKSFKNTAIVMIEGTWEEVLVAKQKIISQITSQSSREDLDLFFTFMFSRISRAGIRDITRYVHSTEQESSSNRRNKPHKYWDIFTSEFLIANSSDPISVFRRKVLSHFLEDPEILLCVSRLSASFSDFENLLSAFGLSAFQALAKFMKYFESVPENNHRAFEKQTRSLMKSIEAFLIEKKALEKIDIASIVSQTSKGTLLNKPFTTFPISFQNDVEEDCHIFSSCLNSYFENLKKREIVLPKGQKTSQKVTHTPVLLSAKEKADIMVCSYTPDNTLYVIFADHNASS